MPSYGKRARARNRLRLSEGQLDLFDPIHSDATKLTRAARLIAHQFGFIPQRAAIVAALAGFPEIHHD